MRLCKKKRFCQSGYTLVELMLALVMSGVVMSAIFVIVSGSHKYILKGRDTLSLQEDYSLIETLLAGKIRQAVGGEQKIYNDYDDYLLGAAAQDSGSCLKLKFYSGDSCVIYRDGSDFKIINPDLSVTNLVQGTLSDLLFVQQNNAIRTEIMLDNNQQSMQNILVDAFRSFGSSSGGLGGRRCELIIQASQVPGALNDFPVLLTEASLPEEMLDANGSDSALDGGGDIRFSSDEAGESRLACEIVTFATHQNPANANAEIWVNVPTISSSANTSIWVWYNTSGATQPAGNAQYGSQSVWQDSYELVLHMSEDPQSDTPQFKDATANERNGTNNGGLISADLINGVIGDGIDFDGSSNDDIDLGIWDVTGSAVTVQHWVSVKPSTNSDASFISRTTGTSVNNYLLMTGIDGSGTIVPRYRLKTFFLTTNLEGSSFSTNTWYFMAVTYDGNFMRTWVNNQNVLSTNKFGSMTTSGSVHMFLGDDPTGSRQLKGKMDEVRVSNVKRADTWLLAEYNNQLSPETFVIAGTPETL